MERLVATDPSTLIDGVAVRSERNSATEYIANLDFSFQAGEVRDLLARQGIPFVDTQAPATILVPLTRDAKAAAGPSGEFRAASGTWGSVWPTLDLTNSVSPLKVETLKPELGPDTLRGLYDEATRTASVMTLAAAYGTDQVVLAIAEVDTEGRKVNVLLAGQDAAGPFALQRAYRLNDGDLAYTFELAAVVSQGIVEGRWKAVNSGGAVAAANPATPGAYPAAASAGMKSPSTPSSPAPRNGTPCAGFCWRPPASTTFGSAPFRPTARRSASSTPAAAPLWPRPCRATDCPSPTRAGYGSCARGDEGGSILAVRACKPFSRRRLARSGQAWQL